MAQACVPRRDPAALRRTPEWVTRSALADAEEYRRRATTDEERALADRQIASLRERVGPAPTPPPAPEPGVETSRSRPTLAPVPDDEPYPRGPLNGGR